MSLSSVSVDAVVDRYRATAERLGSGAPVAVPLRTPEAEIRRSPAAAAVGRLAAADGLHCFHFEHRHHLALPEHWVPAHDPELAEPPSWDQGVLPEAKYQSFRHDLPLGSFHPHHRAKWSTHELCHGLVGFAWRPDATPFFHATAGRLAELLPVALWYFLDEAFLTRCEEHQGQGALFRTFCPACERAAVATPDDAHAAEHLAGALRFLDRELAAIARSRRLGRPVSHRWATIDLCSDGVAYARAHGARLSDPVFHSLAEQFFVEGGGHSATLEALEARVEAVALGLMGEADPPPLAPSAALGFARWTLQDVAWRLLQVAAETEGDAHAGLMHIVQGLAAAVPTTTRADGDPAEVDAALATAAEAYRALHAEIELPHPDDLLALGYPHRTLASGVENLVDGLTSCMPLTQAALERAWPTLVTAFAAEDAPRRAHVAARFADWLQARHPGPLADLGRWEASLAVLPRRAPNHLDGPAADPRITLSAGVVVVRTEHDPLALVERVDAGEVVALKTATGWTLTALEGEEIEASPTGLLLGRDPAGEILILDVDPALAEALAAGPVDTRDLDPGEVDALLGLGVVHPQALRETTPAS